MLLRLGSEALLIIDRLRCRFAHFNLRAHLLDLRGLLFELGHENLYLSLLLGDLFLLMGDLLLLLRGRCFQLLNFVVEPGLGLNALATTQR